MKWQEGWGGTRQLRKGTGRWCRPNPHKSPPPPQDNPPPMPPKRCGPRVSCRPQGKGDPLVCTCPAGGLCSGSNPVLERQARQHDLGEVGAPPGALPDSPVRRRARAPGVRTLSVGVSGPGAHCRVSP